MKAAFTGSSLPQTPVARRARGQVVTYKEARDGNAIELWEQMERLIDPIDRAPESVAAFFGGPLSRFENWVKDLDQFFASLPRSGQMKREQLLTIERMGLARVEITRDINLHLGAAPEVLRRYSEEYIPQAQERANDTRDPEDEYALNGICRRKEDFLTRTTLMERTRLLAVNTAMFLRQTLDNNDMTWAHAQYAQVVRPGLQNARREVEGGAPQEDIKVMKPLRFKAPKQP